jgi:hypothetical protein
MKKSTFISIIFITFLPFIAIAAPPNSVGPVKSVEVVNTPGVTIENTPAVTVPDGVTVNNDDTSPVPVSIIDGGGFVIQRQPFSERTFGQFDGVTDAFVTFTTVPSDKILVVEAISCQLVAPETEGLAACRFINEFVGGETFDLSMPISKSPAEYAERLPSPGPAKFQYSGVFSGRIYVLPNATPQIFAVKQSVPSTPTSVRGSISGYYIDSTSPTLSP